MPGTRAFTARAVLAGGGSMHRLGLGELYDLPAALALLGGRRWAPGLRPSATASRGGGSSSRALAPDALIVAAANAKVILLDKLSPEQVAAVVAAARPPNLPPPGPPIIMAWGRHNRRLRRGLRRHRLHRPSHLRPPVDIVVTIEPR